MISLLEELLNPKVMHKSDNQLMTKQQNSSSLELFNMEEDALIRIKTFDLMECEACE